MQGGTYYAECKCYQTAQERYVVPVAFKDVTPDGKLVVGDVFLDTTLKNLSVGAAAYPIQRSRQAVRYGESSVPNGGKSCL